MKKVIMNERDYLREHKKLIKLLDSSKRRDMKKEAKSQKMEVMRYLQNR